ncbi:uncharacterized protein LOC135824603 [Sycon ciliatum]|uniref:uncharacterized protein LOC135824603 n=1 Tax=Sycon ciliatum TaxID=27933 RepID=UPI0031F6C0A4
MGNIQFYPDIYADLEKWNSSTRANVTDRNTKIDALLATVNSTATTTAALAAINESATYRISQTVPLPTGAASQLPLLLDRNCLLNAYSINATYERVYADLNDLLKPLNTKIENTKIYLTALAAVDTPASVTQVKVTDANVASLQTDTGSNSWPTQKTNLTTLALDATYKDPRLASDQIPTALSNLSLSSPTALKTFVATVITTYSENRMAVIAAANP